MPLFRHCDIADTTDFFVITECYIEGVDSSDGIILNNVSASTAIIANNIINHKWNGVYLSYSNNVAVKNNMFSACGYSISISRSNYTSMINNTCYDGGIHSYNSEYIKIESNTITSLDESNIYLWYSHYSVINDNTCTNL